MLLSPLILGQTTSPDIVSDLMLVGVKGMFLIGMLLYFIFSIVVIRQIHVMKNTLITPFSPIIQLIGLAHFLVACGVGVFLWGVL